MADTAMGRGWDEPAEATRTRRQKRAADRRLGAGRPGVRRRTGAQRRGGHHLRSLHVAGGVLKYGIPEFRLPDMIIDAEIENLKKLGVEIRLDTIIGKLFTIPQLLAKWATTAVFVGTGAGSPKFTGIPGEALQRRLLRQRISDAREPDARLPAADLRYAGGHGQARGGGGRGQYRHGCGARVAAHGRRAGVHASTGGRAANRPRVPRSWSTPSRRASSSCWLTNPVEILGNSAGLGDGHALPEDGVGRAGCFRAARGRCRSRARNSCWMWIP